MKKKNLKIEKKLLHDDEDFEFVNTDKSKLFLMVWEITKDQYSFIRGKDAERRLQRNVVSFSGKQS